MTDSECIILTLRALQEATDTVLHPVLQEGIATTCYYLMGISLMTYVKDKLVLRCIIDIMKGYYKLHRAKTWSQVAWIHRTALYHILTNLLAKLLELVHIQTFYVCRRVHFA